MKASLQEKIAPFSSNDTQNFSAKKIQSNKKTDGSEPKVDFRKLILESNAEEKKRLENKSNGDLSSAESYEDFLQQLNEQTTQREAPKTTLGKDDFMKLFVTQLQHQDPLNPKDGAEMAAQLAQFNGLEQMQNVNTAIETLQNISSQSNNMNMLNYIGKEVDGDGGIVKWDGNNVTPAYFHLESPAQRIELTVKNSAGKAVRTIPLGAFDSGKHDLKWDGMDNTNKPLTQGQYTYELTSEDNNQNKTKIPIKTRLTIQGVDMSGDSNEFITDVGPITTSKISSVRLPQKAASLEKPIINKALKHHDKPPETAYSNITKAPSNTSIAKA